MNIAVLTDIHGKPEGADAIAADLRAADLVVLPGDLTMFGREADAERVVGAIRKHNDRILAVMGNCDYPEVAEFLSKADQFIHRGHREVNGVGFVGLGGSLPCPIPTLNEWSEEEIAEHLDAAIDGYPSGTPMILVSHQPAKDTAVDLAGNGQHVGSEAVRGFIERHQPAICLSGHIHEAQGTDRIGETILVNPGPFMEGRYAWLVGDGASWSVDIRDVPGG